MKYIVHLPDSTTTQVDVPKVFSGTAVVAFILDRHPEVVRVERRVAVCGKIIVHLIWEKK